MPSEHRGTEGRGDHSLLPLQHVGREMQDKRDWDREAVCLPLNSLIMHAFMATLSNNPCFSTGTNYLVNILLANGGVGRGGIPQWESLCCYLLDKLSSSQY